MIGFINEIAIKFTNFIEKIVNLILFDCLTGYCWFDLDVFDYGWIKFLVVSKPDKINQEIEIADLVDFFVNFIAIVEI